MKILNSKVKILFRIFLFLLFFEVFLRAEGFMRISIQEYENKKKLSESQSQLIMCVGDSNTYLGGEDGYPFQLEKILNQRFKDKKFSVLNKGLPAADSTIIMKDFESWVDHYKPDMVVVMMGLNDRTYYVAQGKISFVKKLDSILSYAKTYKMLSKIAQDFKKNLERHPWFSSFASLRDPSNQASGTNIQKNNSANIPPSAVKLFLAAMNLKKQGDYGSAEKLFKKLIKDDYEKGAPERYGFTDKQYLELEVCLYEQKKFDELFPIIKYIFQRIDEYEIVATEYVRGLCESSATNKGMTETLEALVKDKPDSLHFNGLLTSCYSARGDEQLANLYLDKFKSIRNERVNPTLKNNYLKLVDILGQRNIMGVIVQYPLVEIDPLKNMLKESKYYDSLIFIDNNESFKEAVRKDGYPKYFNDRAADENGHCTREGNRFLAENIIRGITAYGSKVDRKN